MSEYDKLRDIVDEKGLVKFTQELIKLNSVYDGKKEGFNEERVAKYIADFLRENGFEVTIQEVVKGRPNVIAILNGKNTGRTLLFEGHTDVVTAGDIGLWTVDPFGAEIKEGRIYGRGSCDTKGNVAAAIFAVKAIKESKIDFNGKIMLCIPVDGEGMMIGIKDFIKKGWADTVDAAIICEPQENQINLLTKGAMRIEIRVYGKMTHGCTPREGINPILRVSRIIGEIEKLEERIIDTYGRNELIGYPSITPTIVMAPSQAEAQLNVVPGEAYLAIDIRTIPGQDHNEIKQEFQKMFIKLRKEDSDFKAEFNVIEERPCVSVSRNEPAAMAMDKAHGIVTGKPAIYGGVLGATDGTFLNALKGIPVITSGAGGLVMPHHADEYVEIEELIEITKIYALTAIIYLNEHV